MKRFVGIVLALCVVAPSSFGIALIEYTWSGTDGNFTDTTWTVVQAGTTPVGYPAVPFESANTTAWTAYSRPAVANGGNVTVNTDLAPLNIGYQQFQLTRGSVIVDNGGELRVGQGYLAASMHTSQTGGLVVQNGGQYICDATATGNQNGTLFTYTTALSTGTITISGDGTIFDAGSCWYGGRHGQSQVRNAVLNILGSGSQIDADRFGPGGNNLTMTLNFTTDALGVSPIDISTSLAFNQGVTLSHVNNVAKLNFVLGAAPIMGQVFTLFDLAPGAVSTGTLRNMQGAVLDRNRGEHIYVDYAGTTYCLELSYVGGDTGNDVTLTVVPEPATMALLSLGGLVLARRRRA